MIIGNGVDTVNLERFKRVIEKNDRFIKRNFTKQEQLLFEVKGMKIESIAANFAVKEAVSKAFGTGFRGFNLIDIEVLRDPLGKPYVNLYDQAHKKIQDLGGKHLHVSISHDTMSAIAFVILEG